MAPTPAPTSPTTTSRFQAPVDMNLWRDQHPAIAQSKRLSLTSGSLFGSTKSEKSQQNTSSSRKDSYRGERRDAIHKLEVAMPLPLIDLYRTPLAWLATKSRPLLVVMSVFRRHFGHFAFCYRVGLACELAVFAVPQVVVAQWLSLGVMVLCLPLLVSSLMMMSVDMLGILTKYFEFWFFTTVNLLYGVSLASLLGDWRMLCLVSQWMDLQTFICMDANFRTIRLTLKHTLFNMAILGFTMLSVYIELVPMHKRHLTYGAMDLELVEVFFDSAFILLILLLRRSFSKRKVLSSERQGKRIIRCVLFRTSLVLRNVSVMAQSGGSANGRKLRNSFALFGKNDTARFMVVEVKRMARRPSMESGTITTINEADSRRHSAVGMPPGWQTLQLQTSKASQSSPTGRMSARGDRNVLDRPSCFQQTMLVSLRVNTLDLRRVMYSVGRCTVLKLPTDRLALQWLVLLYSIGIVGLLSTSLAMGSLFLVDNSHAVPIVASLLSFACTSGFCGVLFLHANSQLLRLLGKVFSFWFLSFQASCACVALMDLLQWDLRCLAVASCWQWFQLCLCFDTLTPPYRHRLGLCKKLVAPITMLILMGWVWLMVMLTWHPTTASEQLADRRILLFAGVGIQAIKDLEVRTKPFLLARLVMLLVWTLRLTTGCFADEKELLLINGEIDYFTPLEMFPTNEVANRRSVQSMYAPN